MTTDAEAARARRWQLARDLATDNPQRYAEPRLSPRGCYRFPSRAAFVEIDRRLEAERAIVEAARAAGRREGLEEAAKIAEDMFYDELAAAIRART